MEQKAFTIKADGRVHEIRTKAGLFQIATDEQVLPSSIESFEAIWDTGASRSAIASSVVSKLNMAPISFAQVSTAGGIVKAPVYILNVVLPNNVIISNLQVTELKDLNSCDMLLGMDVISQGDFAVTHFEGKACFSFRMPSSRPIDFVPESNQYNIRLNSAVNKGKKNIPKKKRRKENRIKKLSFLWFHYPVGVCSCLVYL